MDLNSILRLVAIVACPIAMGLMMWWMTKNMNSEQGHSMTSQQTPANSAERLAALRAQQQALKAEIAEAERLAELEAKRDALLAAKKPSNPANKDAVEVETQTATN
jgi:flagellar basal body-associated protein FliL